MGLNLRPPRGVEARAEEGEGVTLRESGEEPEMTPGRVERVSRRVDRRGVVDEGVDGSPDSLVSFLTMLC